MHKRYSYENLKNDIKILKSITILDKNIKISNKYKTYMGNNLYLLKFGTGEHRILLTAAFHGMEDITAKILMQFAKNLLKLYRNYDQNALEIFTRTSIYMVPMVNPDGIAISMNKIKTTDAIYPTLLYMNESNPDFTKWQANSRGVDINHNFDADWELSEEYEKKLGIFGPSRTKYSGEKPESEIESRFLVELVKQHNFEAVMAFHSQGEEIYYDFNGKIPKSSAELVKRFERVSGYRGSVPLGSAAFGGFKDWFIKEYNRSGFTIEVGKGENPLPPEQFDEIYPKSEAIIYELLKYYV